MTPPTLTRAIVHIGPQKTGTTHLARYLTLAHEECCYSQTIENVPNGVRDATG